MSLVPDTKSFRGDFSFDLRVRGTFDEVEAIADQILEILPDEVIHIKQHVARVRLEETER